MTHQVRESIVFVSRLTPNEVSKNAANVTNGMFRAMIGPKMKTLDKMPTKQEFYVKMGKIIQNSA